jgi:hypothetical protein
VITMDREAFEAMDETVPTLRTKAWLPGAGHWIQQQRPAQVKQSLQEFLATLSPVGTFRHWAGEPDHGPDRTHDHDGAGVTRHACACEGLT